MDPVTITIAVVDGPDRGRVFPNLKPGISIGREEGNTVLLRDERVSRFHAKIYSTGDEIVITDLQSTNGTFVNGDPIRFSPLTSGDRIMMGRTVLVVHIHEGSRSDDEPSTFSIVQVSRDVPAPDKLDELPTPEADERAKKGEDFEFVVGSPGRSSAELPPLPSDLTQGQKARIIRILDWIHRRLRSCLWSAVEDPSAQVVRIPREEWQRLVETIARITEQYRELVEPSEE